MLSKHTYLFTILHHYFSSFVIRFAKCYYVHFQDMESALEMITELEKKSAKNPIDEDDSYNKIRDAVIHVILATKCSIMMKTKKNEVSEVGTLQGLHFSLANIY